LSGHWFDASMPDCLLTAGSDSFAAFKIKDSNHRPANAQRHISC
jgi:hypothetical protein